MKRRIIYNHDGTCALCRDESAPEMPVKQAVEEIAGTQVDTFCWCIGSANSMVFYNSKAADILCAETKSFLRRGLWQVGKNLRGLIDKNSCPLEVAIKEGHKAGIEVFASLRMNDGHHAHDPKGPLAARIWKEHPEYRLKRREEDKVVYPPVFWDYAHPEVRQHVLDIVKDVAGRYEIDGFELDFGRSPWVFSWGETKKNAPILTELVRDIKEILTKKGKEKNGKPILLSARVPESPLMSIELGIDAETWIKQGLLEFIAFGERDINTPVGQYKDLAKNGKCGIYPCIGGCADERGVFMGPETYRAWALNFYREGADGIYLFNMPCLPESGIPIPTEVLFEIGTRETIDMSKPRHYAYYLYPDVPGTRKETVEEMLDRHLFFSHEPQMPRWQRSVEGVWQEVLFKIADDIENKQGIYGELSFKLLNMTRTDEVRVKINGTEIESDKITRKINNCGRDPETCNIRFDPYYKYTIKVNNQTVKKGSNTLSVFITSKTSELKVPVGMEHLEVWVKSVKGDRR